MCRAANLSAFMIPALVTGAALIVLLALTGCRPEIVLSKTTGGCSETTLRSIDNALIKLTEEKTEVKP